MSQTQDIGLSFETFDIACASLDMLIACVKSSGDLNTSHTISNLRDCVLVTLSSLIEVRIVYDSLEDILDNHGWWLNQFRGHVDKEKFLEDLEKLYDRLLAI